MSWTEERIERLKKMWHDGATASQIADELGGVSRNAVIGKAHRLGLEQRPSPVKPGEEKEVKKAAPAPKAAAPKAEAPSPAKAAPAAEPAAAQAAPPTQQRSAPEMQYRSIGPGGFVRQGPGDQQAQLPRRDRRPPPPLPFGGPRVR